MADKAMDDAELRAKIEHSDSRCEMYRRAVKECKELVHDTLRRAGGGWASDGPDWFEEDVAPGFHQAIVVKNIDWSGRLRESAIKKLHEMCMLALETSGPSKIVNRHHSKFAFEALRCKPACVEGPTVVVAFCE